MKKPSFKTPLSIAKGALQGCVLACGAALVGNFLGGTLDRIVTTMIAGLMIGAVIGWANTTVTNANESNRTDELPVVHITRNISAPRYLELAASRFDRRKLGRSSAAYRWWDETSRSKGEFSEE